MQRVGQIGIEDLVAVVVKSVSVVHVVNTLVLAKTGTCQETPVVDEERFPVDPRLGSFLDDDTPFEGPCPDPSFFKGRLESLVVPCRILFTPAGPVAAAQVIGEAVPAGLFNPQEFRAQAICSRNSRKVFFCLGGVLEDPEDEFGIGRSEVVDRFEGDSRVSAPQFNPPCNDDPPSSLCRNIVERPQLLDEPRFKEECSKLARRLSHLDAFNSAAKPSFLG